MANREDKGYIYILSCADGTLYTGWTNDLQSRLDAHNAGRGARYTRTRLPVKLVYWEDCGGKIAAMKREYAVKKLTRRAKLALISAWNLENAPRAGAPQEQ